ncbi:MAG: NAAT family transporter [Gammaproteobacteria bacterium]|nr:NAAT family transporter [Gammaproteobacteria bacterium]
MLDYTEYTKFLISLLAVVNPIGVVPIFITMTADLNSAEQRRIAKLVVLATATVLLISLFFGELVLNFFGISINSFRVGGGIMLLLMAISMLHTSHTTIRQHREIAEQASESMAVVPLAIPLLAGPAAISTVIINAYKGHGVEHYVLMSLDIIALTVILALLFLLMPWIASRISTLGINISTRIMGLILAAIAVEFIANGLKGLFPVLA